MVLIDPQIKFKLTTKSYTVSQETARLRHILTHLNFLSGIRLANSFDAVSRWFGGDVDEDDSAASIRSSSSTLAAHPPFIISVKQSFCFCIRSSIKTSNVNNSTSVSWGTLRLIKSANFNTYSALYPAIPLELTICHDISIKGASPSHRWLSE